MLNARPPVAATLNGSTLPVRTNLSSRSAPPGPLPVLRCVLSPQTTASLPRRAVRYSKTAGLFEEPTVGRSVLAKMSALRTWVSGATSYGSYASQIWGEQAESTLQQAMSELSDSMQAQGLEGLAQSLMHRDPLEKQVLLHHVAQSVKPSQLLRQKVMEFAKSMATLEQATLDFLCNTISVFRTFDRLHPNGASRLRAALHEAVEAATSTEIKPVVLAQALLRRFEGADFDDAMRALGLGVKADLMSTRMSALTPRLLASLEDKSIFRAATVVDKVSKHLCLRLATLGVRGHCSSADLACMLLAGADSGSSELPYLLTRYLGPETAEAVLAKPAAIECFCDAFNALPITLWPAAQIHRRDILQANLDRLRAASGTS